MTKVVLLLVLSSAITVGGVINFDNLPTSQPWEIAQNAWDPVPASYAGFTWVGWEIMNQGAYSVLYGDGTPPPSNPNFAYSGTESATLSIGSTTPFLFLGARFAGWPAITDPVASSVTIDGYSGGILVGSTTLNLSATGWSTSGGIVGPVDTLLFTPENLYFRMDDVQLSTIDDSGPLTTPEPATVALFGVGLLSLAITGKRAVVTDSKEG